MARKKPPPVDEPKETIRFVAAKKAKLLAQNLAQLAEFTDTALVAAKELGIKTKPLERFTLSPAQREILLAVPSISKSIKTKLGKAKASFTIAEVAAMATALVETSMDEPQKQLAVLLVAKHLVNQLQEQIAEFGKATLQKAKQPKRKADPNTVYQFKITLVESKPPIWRRIQVEDCTLDKLHEHIQTAMGWTNSHLHHFRIGEQLYGDPMLMEENMEEMGYKDSTRTNISKIVPKTGKRFKFSYEYDFGDSWEHEILFEGCPKKKPGKEYPVCLEGKRACPPEDVGGNGGFYEFLEALADPKHEQHDDFMEWGGDFDSENFDAKQATREMKKGLPDWRN